MKKTGSVLLTIVMLTLVGGIMLLITLLTTLAFVAVRKPGVHQAEATNQLPAGEMSSSLYSGLTAS